MLNMNWQDHSLARKVNTVLRCMLGKQAGSEGLILGTTPYQTSQDKNTCKKTMVV